jgi:hypothetical protein
MKGEGDVLPTDRLDGVASDRRAMPLADQVIAAASGAANSHALDQISRQLWRALTEGHIPDADAEALSEFIEARRATLAGKVVLISQKAVLGLPRASKRAPRLREKVFGLGRPRPLDRNAKARIMHWARCLSRRTEAGRAYGEVTAKALAVLEALLWAFHNAKSGLCFPSYEKIADAAHCARSTVAEAIKALEDAGVLSWVNRIKRVREAAPDLFDGHGWRWRVIRTSNAYNFRDPKSAVGAPVASKSEKPTGTTNQAFFSSLPCHFSPSRGDSPDRSAAVTGREGQVKA